MPQRLASILFASVLCLACDSGETEGSGGSASTSSTTGAGGEDCGCGPLEQCFGELCVAKLVELPNGTAIDATEVTRAQYGAWLATNPSPTSSSDPDCVNNITYEPEDAWPERGCTPNEWTPGERGDHPAVCVGWCDAHDYCASVGKRLCGAIGGGPNAYGDLSDPNKSAWFAACSSGGVNSFPYGDTFDSAACNGDDAGLGEPAPVGSFPSCQSPDPAWAGVFDMSGNVWEWEDSCFGDAGDIPCRLRGGASGERESGLLCGNEFYWYKISTFGPNIGFRCCSP